ncbi:hypothetical protein P3T36_000478 [Kitasatospora sp. MAP12-15]|uniref:PE-PGRS family protein n=1 Tax=unclassified Kitasatospora TaxID=2633591 RepID=UPI002476F141|nr:PE-PGRS family protein [Kitasatospora sp. MAP12-44]MDH6109707.1 hypothetical protein [Kitasatospora sp. MAP12-44]
MPESHHEVEWNQVASRSSDIVDPVLTVRQLSGFGSLGGRPGGRADCALVFATAKGSYQVYAPPLRPTRGELAGRRYRAMFEVDTGIHHFTLTELLPSRDDEGAFRVDVEVSWQVTAADRVVSSGLRDVPALITPRIRRLMRTTARQFAVDLSHLAEPAVQQALAAEPIALGEGLYVGCTVHLDLDERAKVQRQLRRDYRYAREAHADALRMAQEQAELISQKAKFYQYHLDQGGVSAWALRLAEHPDDLPMALEHLRGEQQDLVRNQIALVEKLLETSHFEQFQLEEPARAALEALTSILRRETGGSGAPQLSASTELG